MPTLTFETLKALRSLGAPQLLPDQKSRGLYVAPTGNPRVWHVKLRDRYSSPLLDE